MSSARRTWCVVGALALLGLGLAPFWHKGTSGATELPVYVTAAHRMREGAEIYRVDDAKPFTYPPFFALPFLPFPSVPAERPRPPAPFVAWYLINVAVIGVAVALIHRRLVRPPLPGERRFVATAFWAITAALAARHVLAAFGNQSHDLLVLLAIALGIESSCRRHDARAGVWAGIAAACKATPLLFGWAFLVQRRVVALIALGLGGAAATLLPDVLFPRQDGGLWGVAWFETFVRGVQPGEAAGTGPWTAGTFLNQSLSGTLHRLLTPVPENRNTYVLDVALWDAGDTARRALTAAAACAVLAALAFLVRPSASRGAPPERLALRRFGEASAVVCGMVLLSPMSSKSHFCVLLLPMAFCTARFLACRSVVLGTLLVAIFAIGTCTTKGIVSTDLGNRLLAYGAVTWAAALSLLATGVALRLVREPAPSEAQ